MTIRVAARARDAWTAPPADGVKVPAATGRPLRDSLRVEFVPGGGGRREGRSAVASGPGPATRIAADIGPRAATLRQYHDGVTELDLGRPPIEHLVLGGGGAKGMAYPGAVQTLEARGVLAGIRTLSGSSAGGITAALLASGMDAARFKTLSDGLDMMTLLDSDKAALAFVQKLASGLGRDLEQRLDELKLGKVGDLARLLCELLPRMNSGAVALETLIREQTRAAVLARLDQHPECAYSPRLAAIDARLRAGGAVTFADLEALSRHLPEIKALNITGSAMFRGRPQLALFNASTTPDMDIAVAAHISAAFPAVFRQVEYTLPFMRTASGGEKTRFQDGGVMLNVPLPALTDRPPEPGAIRRSDALVLVFEGEDGPGPARATRMSAAMDWVVGAPQRMREAVQADAMKAYADQMVVVPLKVGAQDYSGMLTGTLNFSMPDASKLLLQSRLAEAVDVHLDRRGQERERYRFDSMDAALLALDDASLNALSASRPELAVPVQRWRASALGSLTRLADAIGRAEAAAAPGCRTPEVEDVLLALERLVATPAQREWLGTELNRAERTDYARILNLAARWPQNGGSTLRAALAQRDRLAVATIAANIGRELVYPAIYRHGQSDANIAVLRRALHRLEQAGTREQINAVLTGLCADYTARGLTDRFVERVRGWRLPERTA
jgi:exoenzyme U